MKTEELLAKAEKQLVNWPLAADNYKKLGQVKQKKLRYGDVPMILQHNPSRAISTGAKVDAAAINSRPCFLCKNNRPKEQFVLENFLDWEVLINPFPIFNLHFTIAHKNHQHQDNVNFAEMAEFALIYSNLLCFYNGSSSGASCPDHLHFQATLQGEFPLCQYLEKNTGKLISLHENTRILLIDELPSPAIHFISESFSSVISNWLDSLLQQDEVGRPDKSLRNVLMWRDKEEKLHTVLFPRACHRPTCYTAELSEDKDKMYMVSPGAVDMACLIITPKERDYVRLTSFEVARILSEVSYDFTASDMLRNLLLK